MRRIAAVLAAAVLTALGLAGAAAPAGKPTELLVSEQPFQPRVQPQVDAALSIAAGAPPTARVAWYVPRGYAAELTLPIGTKLGTASISFATAAGTVSGQGSVTADDPAAHQADACAPGSHAGVWLVSATLSGQPFALVLYVDVPPAPASAQAAFELQACFDPATTSGRALSSLELVLDRGFTNPAAAGDYVWRALVTPYGAGDVPSPNGATEVQSLVPLPHAVTIRTRYDAKRKRLAISGTAVAGRGRDDGSTVVIATTTDLSRPLKQLGLVRADSNGVFTFAHAFARTAYVVVAVPRLSFGSDCEPTIGSSPCTLETIAPSDPAIRRVVVKR